MHNLDELRAWDGDIWAINHTVEWLRGHGIRSTLFSVDPVKTDYVADEAIMGTVCQPEVLRRIPNLRVFDMIETHEDGLAGGRSSAMRAAALSIQMGYLDVSFFGCEGSFEASDHVDRDEVRDHQLIIRAGGCDYKTRPDFLVYCEEFVQLFATFPDIYHNRSGGLLKAMIEYPDTWEVVAVSASLKQHLEELNGAQGRYDEPYRPAA